VKHLRAYIDGGSRGNPGPAAAGVAVVDADSGRPVRKAGFFLGEMTNNQAEYHGLLRAIEICRELGADRVSIVSDSQLMVRQIHGEYRVKSSTLKPLHRKALDALDGFEAWDMSHVLREQNEQADALANEAMDAQTDVTDARRKPPVAGSTPEAGTRGGDRGGASRSTATASNVRTVTCPHCGERFDLPAS